MWLYTQYLVVLGVVVPTCTCLTYDYVVVGAGTCGLVIANRLSENTSVQVAVIEPGNDVRDYPNVTAVVDSGIYFNASIDWGYLSTPQPLANNRSILYHAGKAIGGTSTINGMMYIRGDKAQFDAWEGLGNTGWNWDTLFPYFKKSENFTIPSSAQTVAGASYDPWVHGESGYLKTGFPYELSNGSLYDIALQSWQALGIPHNKDINSGDTRGFIVNPRTADRDADIREDAARAYYEPVESRSNLVIIKGTVKRITWGDGSEENLVADGVEYFDANGALVQLKAEKEVILSAGTHRSPLILESSGIGNSRLLTQYGIEVKVDLPGVGEFLQDQELSTFSWTGTENDTGITNYVTMATAHDLFGSNTSAIATSTKASLPEWAVIASVASNGAIDPAAFETRFRVQHELIFAKNVTVTEILTSGSTSNTLGAACWILMPFSRGSVHLGSPEAINNPIIDPKFLSIDFDLQMLIGAGSFTRQSWATPPLANLVTGQLSPNEETLPPNATKDQWTAFVRSTVGTTWHAIGTCAMASRDLGGVVDPELKVYGTKNVRIVDASVLPLQMSGHPTATLYAVAERAADLIRGAWKH
ncbi:GMC oxidoreductase [Xylariales sp. PMI_506]|nr:GMC oxidoreductase [Xylariales sp. PMI_506]